MDHSKKAEELFKEGYNCAQAVFAAYSEELGIDIETALKLSSSFGGGMGRMREVCGAVSGMFMAAGLKYGYSDPKDKEAKANHYKLIQNLAHAFKERNGSIICRDLLGLSKPEGTPVPEERTADYYKKRPCAELVKDAAEILNQYMEDHEPMKIAVATEGNQIFQHFGKCPTFTVYTTENGEITGKELIDASQNGHAALTGFLKGAGADTVICGGIGEGARNMLDSAGIKLVSGVEGNIDDAVSAFLTGTLLDQGGSCTHHDHEEGHSCNCKNHCN